MGCLYLTAPERIEMPPSEAVRRGRAEARVAQLERQVEDLESQLDSVNAALARMEELIEVYQEIHATFLGRCAHNLKTRQDDVYALGKSHVRLGRALLGRRAQGAELDVLRSRLIEKGQEFGFDASAVLSEAEEAASAAVDAVDVVDEILAFRIKEEPISGEESAYHAAALCERGELGALFCAAEDSTEAEEE